MRISQCTQITGTIILGVTWRTFHESNAYSFHLIVIVVLQRVCVVAFIPTSYYFWQIVVHGEKDISRNRHIRTWEWGRQNSVQFRQITDHTYTHAISCYDNTSNYRLPCVHSLLAELHFFHYNNQDIFIIPCREISLLHPINQAAEHIPRLKSVQKGITQFTNINREHVINLYCR